MRRSASHPIGSKRNSSWLTCTVSLRVLTMDAQYYLGVDTTSRAAFGTRRRTQLFDALVDLFLTAGFAHLTLDEIAGRLRCSKSTLYALADSKEQLVVAETVHFFRRATAEVEDHISAVSGARARITEYLSAVGNALDAASDQFMADLDAFLPARAVYE